MSSVTYELTPRAWTFATLPTLTPAIRTSAFGTSSPVSLNSALRRYPWAANGIVPPNCVHTKIIRPRHDSVNAIAANTADRLGAWVTTPRSTRSCSRAAARGSGPTTNDLRLAQEVSASATVRHTGPFASELEMNESALCANHPSQYRNPGLLPPGSYAISLVV